MQRIAPLSRSLLRTQAVQTSKRYSSGHGFKPDTEVVAHQRTSLSSIPVPQGSWAEYHNKRNAKWNLYLAVSGTLFAVTMAVMYKEGVWYLHSHPPMKNK